MRVIISLSLLSWNPSDFVYHPELDLGIREEWLPKHPVATRVSTSIDVLNQDDSSNDDDAQFWQSIQAIEDGQLVEVIIDMQPVPNSTEACRLDAKPMKLLLLVKKPYTCRPHNHH